MSENVASEAPLSVSRARSVGLVPFLFGVTRQAELPGIALTRLLGDLGLTEAAARALLQRMCRDGQLARTRRGRGVDYRLAGNTARGFDRVRTSDRPTATEWTGAFHALLYQVPERDRAFRDALRRAAVMSGYGILQQGVLISLTDRADQLAPLADPPAGATVHRARLAMPAAEAARAARHAWSLDELTARHARHARTLRDAVRQVRTPPAATPATLRRYAELLRDPMLDILRSPRLPAPLLPADWPMPDLQAAIHEVHRMYGVPAVGYARSLVAEAGGAAGPGG
ncbi:PaaX family transcriptional regulator C-terminal domain-containing protein [Micromonospora zhanjiangensis]|uniref:PaaX family transcriptional regulator C-terminal domain-containing protein n=1 Tax=Micromonospora zhanjiangensis TaxID=1522057 RepID=A0ABV8KR60_9ACTN